MFGLTTIKKLNEMTADNRARAAIRNLVAKRKARKGEAVKTKPVRLPAAFKDRIP